MLLDIIGEKTTESVKVLGLDDKIGFGKYKDMLYDYELLEIDIE